MPYNHPWPPEQNRQHQVNNLHQAMDYNTSGEPVIRTLGGDTQWAINISTGNVTGVSYIEKFGMNIDVDNSMETIWDGGGVYTYLNSAETVAVTSSSGNDGAAGTGARTVEVQGLDENFNLAVETLTVGGASSTTTFIRVFRVKIITAGSLNVNAGTLSITSDDTSTVLAQIVLQGGVGLGQTFMSVYTVPAGYTAYLTQWVVGAGKQNTDAVCFFNARNLVDNGWNSKDVIALSATTFAKHYGIPLQFTEKTDLEIRGYSTTNNSIVTSSFNLILVQNP